MSGEYIYEAMNAPVQYELQFPEYKFKVGDLVKFQMRFWDSAHDCHSHAEYLGVVMERRFFDGRSIVERRQYFESEDPYEREILSDRLDSWKYKVRVDSWETTVSESVMTLVGKADVFSWEL